MHYYLICQVWLLNQILPLPNKLRDGIPGTKVVKTFNTTGAGNYLNPTFGSENMSMFICGDDEEAKNIVSDLAVQMGFDVVDTGNLMMARVIEQLRLLWISLAYGRQMGPNIGFKLLRR